MREKDIEATRLDYKLSLESEKPKSWLKSVSAFGNTQGGEILLGVTNDTHYAVGLDDPQGDGKQNFRVYCSQNITYT